MKTCTYTSKGSFKKNQNYSQCYYLYFPNIGISLYLLRIHNDSRIGEKTNKLSPWVNNFFNCYAKCNGNYKKNRLKIVECQKFVQRRTLTVYVATQLVRLLAEFLGNLIGQRSKQHHSEQPTNVRIQRRQHLHRATKSKLMAAKIQHKLNLQFHAVLLRRKPLVSAPRVHVVRGLVTCAHARESATFTYSLSDILVSASYSITRQCI